LRVPTSLDEHGMTADDADEDLRRREPQSDRDAQSQDEE
jgi:hypothetical protein